MIRAVVLAALALGCCLGCDSDNKAAPAVSTSTTPPPPSAPPSPAPSPSGFPCSGRPPEHRITVNDFVIELDVMSGNPNPHWKLTADEAREFKTRLLRGEGRIVGVGDGPARLGYRGYIVRVSPSQQAFLREAKLDREFQIAAASKVDAPATAIEDFLSSTMPCSAFP